MSLRVVTNVVACLLAAVTLAGCAAERRQRGFRLEAAEAFQNEEWSGAVRFADAALRAGRPTPRLDAELALLKAEALGHLGYPGERRRLLRYVATVHAGTRWGRAARAALADSVWRSDEDEEASGAILPAIVTVERPWLRHPVEIFYPLEASLARLEGTVLLAIDIDADGRVAAARVLAASDPAFARAVQGAAAAFEVDPAALPSPGTPRTKRLRLDFRLRPPAPPPAPRAAGG